MRRAAHRGGAGERLRHWLAVGFLFALGVAVIMLAGLGSFSHTSKRDDQVNAGPPVPVPQGGAAQHPKPKPPLGPGPPAPRTGPEQQLQATLSGALQAAGPQSGAFVYDLDARDSLFARRIKVGRPPASVEKLYTTVALLRILGPNARLHTDVLGTGRLAHGVWHGNLYLRGGGDPTFGDQSVQPGLGARLRADRRTSLSTS